MTEDSTSGSEPVAGSSPFATGGGGVVFAHRVAAVYLGSLLTEGRRPEADDLPVSRLSFQRDADHPVDDLVVVCALGGVEVSVAVACRATPNFVPSHADSVKLVGSLLSEVEKFRDPSHRVAVAVSGWKTQWDSLARLTEVARSCADLAAFETSLAVEGRWSKPVRERWGFFEQMVAKAVGADSGSGQVRSSAWGLLSRLTVLRFDVLEPDAREWSALASSLDVAAAAGDGLALRDRLVAEAARYDRLGAVVDRSLLRRAVHGLVASGAAKTQAAWEFVAEQRASAVAAVRSSMGDDLTASGPLAVEFGDRRAGLVDAVRVAGSGASALVVAGESGTGKSSLVLSAVADLEASDPGGVEVVVLNFRTLPRTALELRAAVGLPLVGVLRELSASCRLLVVDAADAALEGSSPLLSELVRAAGGAGVGLVVVTSDAALTFVDDQVSRVFTDRRTFSVGLLEDSDVAAVAAHFPRLRTVLADLPAGSLLRRLVVLDLLARTGVEVAGGLSEWDCLQLIWTRLVRGDTNPGGGGSPEAREQTLLAAAEDLFDLPPETRAYVSYPAAVDALRRNHLLLPWNIAYPKPQFAHDEVRRFATAILLFRSPDPAALLESVGVPRWAVSAATLTCKGRLLSTDTGAVGVFLGLVGAFGRLASTHGSRWADVPIEAVFETPRANDGLTAALAGPSALVALKDVVRVAMQRHGQGGLVSPEVVRPVIRVLLDEREPWNISDDSFALLASWLQALVVARVPAGDELRVGLRAKLLSYWKSFPERDPSEERVPPRGIGARRYRARRLDYRLSDEEFVECLALLGPDIDEDVEQCLRALAEDAPGHMAPAADSPLSARAVASRDPELLADLIEAYYIEPVRDGGYSSDAVRRHQGRWSGVGTPFFAYWFGGFWQLFQAATPTTSVRVLNNILNHAAAERVRVSDRRMYYDEVGDQEPSEEGFVLDLDGTPRLYRGDGSTWCWYRGTTVSPYSATSALLAMERTVESWLEAGVSTQRVVEVLLEGCSNLAVPGMLFGVLVRHLEKSSTELDRFLAEPAVWELEFSRGPHEYFGLRAQTEGLANTDRRTWSPHQVAATMVLRGDKDRVAALKRVGETLVENGSRLGLSDDMPRRWAASLDREAYTLTQEGDQVYIEVALPADLQADQERYVAAQANVNTAYRLQNRYWGSGRFDADYVPPTSEEIAADLTSARVLMESVSADDLPMNPLNATAHVVRAAVERAATGDLDALGSEQEFLTGMIVEGGLAYRNNTTQRDDDQHFDQSADRAVAHALPACLTEPLATLFAEYGHTRASLLEGAVALAQNAAPETRLYLAQGTDAVWTARCSGEPCIHRHAVDWLLDTARGAELGPWIQDLQQCGRVWIAGDVISRLAKLPGESVVIDVLDPAIRGLGAATSVDHCMTAEANTLLAALLDVQRRAMVVHVEKGWSADFNDTHALVAARALLDGFGKDGATAPVRAHLDVLRADDGLTAGFLHGLTAAGAETSDRAEAARGLWPAVLSHVVGYATDGGPNPFRGRHSHGWVTTALIPEPAAWARGMYNELSGEIIDWVRAEDLVHLVDAWIPTGAGTTSGADALIGLLRRLPLQDQATRGVAWLSDMCLKDGKATVARSFLSNSWLTDVRESAEEFGALDRWQYLVDAMVVGGNDGLAPYSR